MRAKPTGSAKGSPLGRAVERSETERVRPGRQPSPSRLRRATSPERERLWQGRKFYSLTAGFFLPLTGEDETHPLCQGLHLRGRWHFAKRNDGRGSSRKYLLSRQSTERVSPKTTLHTKMTRADTRAIQIFSAGAADLLSANHFPVSGCCSSQIHSRILSGRFVTMASGPKGNSERSTLRVSTVQNATLTPSA